MKISTYNISLDIHRHASQTELDCVCGDTARRICARFTEDSVPYNIEEGTTALFAASKPDGTAIVTECVIEDGCAVYDFSDQTAAVPGRVECEIRLIDGDGRTVTAPRFSLMVGAHVCDDSEIAESSSEYSALTNAILDARESADAASEAAEKADSAASLAQTQSSAANEAATEASDAAVTAYTAADEIKAAAENGEYNGADGVSPVVSVEEIDGGHRVTVTDASGTQSFDVKDGTDGDTSEIETELELIRLRTDDAYGFISQAYLPSTSYAMYTSESSVKAFCPGIVSGDGYVFFRTEGENYSGSFVFRTSSTYEVTGILPNTLTPITFGDSSGVTVLAWRASVASASAARLEIYYPSEGSTRTLTVTYEDGTSENIELVVK